jgi:nucleoside-diphosphate-sugar epimerase
MATPPPKNILLIGGTGLIGRYILESLILSKASFGRIAIFTSTSTSESKITEINTIRNRGIEVITGDIKSSDDIQRAYEGIDTVVSALGRAVIDAQIKLLEIAEATPNIHWFYPSEFGTDIEYGPQSKDEKPHQHKLAVRRYIKEHVKRVNHVYVVTGPYADLYIGRSRDPRAGSFDALAKTAVLLGTGNEDISLTTMNE